MKHKGNKLLLQLTQITKLKMNRRYFTACSPLVNAAMANSTKKLQPGNKSTSRRFFLPDNKTIIFQRNVQRES